MDARRTTLTAGAAAGGMLTAAFLSAGVALADNNGDNDNTVGDVAGAAAGGVDTGSTSSVASAFNSADFGFDVTNVQVNPVTDGTVPFNLGAGTFDIVNSGTDAPGDTLGSFDAAVTTGSSFGVTVTQLGVTDLTLDFDDDGTPFGDDTFIDIDGDGTALASETDPTALLEPASVPTVDSFYEVASWQLFGDWTLQFSHVLTPEESGGTILDDAELFDADIVDEGFNGIIISPFGTFDLPPLVAASSAILADLALF